MRQHGPQLNRLIQIRDAKELGLVCQCLGDANQAVSVSICFDNGETLGRSNMLAHHSCVVPQGALINLSPASMSFCHHEAILWDFGRVMCGSCKYIGSSGGNLHLRSESRASCASTFAEGYRITALGNCGSDSEQKTEMLSATVSILFFSSSSLNKLGPSINSCLRMRAKNNNCRRASPMTQ